MGFQILGPLCVDAAGRTVAITASRERILLGVLLLHANQPVSADLLVNAIWATEPPDGGRSQLQTCVYRLRKRLGEAGSDQQLIVTEPAGYRINVDPEDLDLFEFRRLVGEARTAASTGNHHDAKAAYRTALGLWRGPALAGIDSSPIRSAAITLEEERMQALEECLDSELAAGGAGELIAELTELVAHHPHREGLHRALMVALYRAGRQADALAAYRHARQLLHDDLGTEPSAELQRLHHAILNRDPDLDSTRAPEPTAAPPPPKPRELPADIAGFTGRVEALKALDELQPPGDDLTRPVVISAIAGTAGVGKTALALHWAHRVADRFPDGHLYLNLRGYATDAPLRPIEALSMMLRSLGTGPDQIPVEEAEASARYRSLLADRQVLVVLDNARSVDQVRPLLPGSPGCLALVTSRDRLAGLVARDGAHRITLDVLSADEAHALLTRLLGNERVAAEPAATTQLASACAYLPLALRIAAAMIDEHPSRQVQTIVAALTAGHRLTALDVPGDEETAVRAALDLSYDAIPEPAQRLFRLLGLVPGPDFTPAAAAALADLPPIEAQRQLDRLAGAHLVHEHTPGRYSFHDLLREHARECVDRAGHEQEGPDAVRRLLDWYLFNADAASRELHPIHARLMLPANLARQDLPAFADRAQALAWLDTERSNLVAAIQYAADYGQPSYAILLGDILRVYFWKGIHSHHALIAGLASRAAAEAGGTLHDQASAETNLADAYFMHGDHKRAAHCYARASSLARQAGWSAGEASAENNLATVRMDWGQLHDAVRHLTRTRELAQRMGHPVLQASALSNLGYVYCDLGDVAESVSLWNKSLVLLRDVEHTAGIATVLANLGRGHEILGRLDQATDYLAQSLALTREIGDRGGESYALQILAATHLDAGRLRQALDHATAALALVRDTDERRFESDAWSVVGAVRRSLGDHDEAIACYETAYEVAGPILFQKAVALVGLGAARDDLGQPERSSVHARQALEIAHDVGYGVLQGQALTVLALTRLSQHLPEQARKHAREALDKHRRTGYRLGEASTLAVLGRIEQSVGDTQARERHWRAAHELFDDIGAPVPADVMEGVWQT